MAASSPKYTPAQYAQERGSICPNCGSDEILGGPVDIDSGGASQRCDCTACDASWTDVYVLAGYEDLER